MKKRFGSKPLYNHKYLKNKINSYEEKMNTNFHGDKVPKRRFSIHLPIGYFD